MPDLNGGALNDATLNESAAAPSGPTTAPAQRGVGFTYLRRVAGTDEVALSYRFDWANVIDAELEIDLRFGVDAEIEFDLRFIAETELCFPLIDVIDTELCFELPFTTDVDAELEFRYDIGGFGTNVDAELCFNAPLVTIVDTELEFRYDILAYNQVDAELCFVYSLITTSPVTLVSDYSITLDKDGRTFCPEEYDVTHQQGTYNWRGTIAIRDIADYNAVDVGDTVTLNLFGELYNFIVDAKTREKRGPVDVSGRLELLGIATSQDTPPQALITQTFPAILASDAVTQLVGQPVTWNLIDWVIPEGVLSATDAAPLALATKIVEAAGGVLEATRDGLWIARNTHIVPLADYPNTVAGVVLSDDENIINISEREDNTPRVNRLRIGTVDEALFNDRIVFEADSDSGLRGNLFVYPSPFRDVRVVHTGPGTVVLTVQSPEDIVQSKTEQIEIKDGTGTLAFPIDAITNIQWDANNLGGLQHEQGSTSVTSTNAGTGILDRYSLVTVTYNTRAKHWRASSATEINVQFLVVDDNA